MPQNTSEARTSSSYEVLLMFTLSYIAGRRWWRRLGNHVLWPKRWVQFIGCTYLHILLSLTRAESERNPRSLRKWFQVILAVMMIPLPLGLAASVIWPKSEEMKPFLRNCPLALNARFQSRLLFLDYRSIRTLRINRAPGIIKVTVTSRFLRPISIFLGPVAQQQKNRPEYLVTDLYPIL